MLSWGNVEGKEEIEDKPWRVFKSQVDREIEIQTEQDQQTEMRGPWKTWHHMLREGSFQKGGVG